MLWPADQPADHLTVALRKLATHIGEPKKFHKAAELLLQLLHQHGAALDKPHAPLLFEVGQQSPQLVLRIP